ncbi:MAG: DUF4337 domain-containing protein [Herminiimonas sp.]|nr:DUF4337 domain-containing protein [Herminiimonas sp.]
MDIDPLDTINSLNKSEVRDRASARLNIWVAITVALLATFMGICKVKDDNIVQTMQQAQANKLDHWSYYQARNIREDVAKATVVQLKLGMLGRSPPEQAAYSEAIREYEAVAADQAKKKDEVKRQAAQDQVDYDAANFRDDQFDLSDALLAIAISLLAVTALTHQRWLYFLALVPTVFGLAMGLSGLMGLGLHPAALIRLLS